MVLGCCGFCCNSGFLCILGRILGVNLEFFHLVLGHIFAVRAKMFFSKYEESVAQRPGLEVYQPLRVKGEAFEPGLEVQVRAR